MRHPLGPQQPGSLVGGPMSATLGVVLIALAIIGALHVAGHLTAAAWAAVLAGVALLVAVMGGRGSRTAAV